MAYSYFNYISDGSTCIYNVPFQYIDKENIIVTIDGVKCLDVTYATPSESYVEDAPEYMWLSDSSIKFVFAPESALVIKIQRFTEKESSVVDFANGAVLTAEDLDSANLQLLYITQEAYDALEGTGVYEIAEDIEELYQDFVASINASNTRLDELEDELTEAVEDAEYWINMTVPTATSTQAGIAKTSTSWQVDSETGIATIPTATSTQAGIAKTSASWQVDSDTGVATVPSATESLAGIVERATNAEASAGTDTTRFVTPYHLKTYAPNPSSATTTTEGLMRFATDEEASDASEVDAAVKPHQVEIIAQAASNAIPSDMTILSTGVGIYRHSSGAGSVIVFGGKQVLVADASYRVGSKTWAAAVSWCAGKTIGGLRCYMPDLDTLRVIWLNRTSIDSYDPTASSNTTKKLSNWGFGSGDVWSRLPYEYDGTSKAWILCSDGDAAYNKVSSAYGALPCIEL